MTDVGSWTERTLTAIVDDRRTYRAEALWRATAENGLDLLIGQMIADLGATRAMLSSTISDEWRAVADLIDGLMSREPLKSGPRYSGERIILGTFAAELRAYALAVEQAHAA